MYGWTALCWNNYFLIMGNFCMSYPLHWKLYMHSFQGWTWPWVYGTQAKTKCAFLSMRKDLKRNQIFFIRWRCFSEGLFISKMSLSFFFSLLLKQILGRITEALCYTLFNLFTFLKCIAGTNQVTWKALVLEESCQNTIVKNRKAFHVTFQEWMFHL